MDAAVSLTISDDDIVALQPPAISTRRDDTDADSDDSEGGDAGDPDTDW